MRPSLMAVLLILGILAIITYWLFLMMAMPETQPGSAVFFDR
jgi:hypothetical protein